MDELYEFIESTSEIECSNCDRKDTVHEEAEFAEETFYADGWRAGRINVYCPVCSTKKLKPKKKSK